jgi:hypothetical protein
MSAQISRQVHDDAHRAAMPHGNVVVQQNSTMVAVAIDSGERAAAAGDSRRDIQPQSTKQASCRRNMRYAR